MKEGIDEIWADNISQTIWDKVPGFEYIAEPFLYVNSVVSLFVDPRARALRKIRRFARKRNFKVIFYKDYKYACSLRNIFLKTYNIRAVLYRKFPVSSKILDDIVD